MGAGVGVGVASGAPVTFTKGRKSKDFSALVASRRPKSIEETVALLLPFNANLKVFSKKDSQEVCFVPNDDYKAFLNDNLKDTPKSGDICLKDGTVLGKHNGLIYYTVGQRKGLNISYKEPLYVIELDTINNKKNSKNNNDEYCEEPVIFRNL